MESQDQKSDDVFTGRDAGVSEAPLNLDLLRLRKQIEGVREHVAGGLLTLVDIKSPQLGAHCRRVARWCRDVGELCSLSTAELGELEMAGLLHDVGFLVSDVKALETVDMVKKDQSRQLRHPSVGYAVLHRIAGFEKIAQAVLHHHERFDGAGFPQRLWGNKIPLYARIISVADRYDLESHPGAGFRFKDPESARRVLAMERGTSLDPDLVNKFLFVLTTVDPVRRFNQREIEITPTALRPGMVLSRDLKSVNKVLLLKADTVLTQAMIDRVLASNSEDWLVTLAYVDISSLREEELPPEMRREEEFPQPNLPILEMPAGIRKPEILVVDDATAVSNALRRELGREGMNVTGATSVPAALDYLVSHTVDAVVADLVIGGPDGFDLLREIDRRFPALHCVVLSGFPTPENIRSLRDFKNVVRFVTKPWSQTILLAALREAILRTQAGTPSG